MEVCEEHVSKAYDGVAVLQDVSFRLCRQMQLWDLTMLSEQRQ